MKLIFENNRYDIIFESLDEIEAIVNYFKLINLKFDESWYELLKYWMVRRDKAGGLSRTGSPDRAHPVYDEESKQLKIFYSIFTNDNNHKPS